MDSGVVSANAGVDVTILFFRANEKEAENEILSNDTFDLFYVDESWKDGVTGLATVWWFIATGSWFSKTCRCPARSAIEAEAQTVLLALEWAVENKLKRIVVCSNAQVVVQTFSKKKRLSN
uniref:RNase H type-1 domain-containing protein n=1 Tax=Cannabis sativa TaxID=3483 RepID=A0A803QRA4_CANSA